MPDVVRINILAERSGDAARPVDYTITQDPRDHKIRVKRIDNNRAPKIWAEENEQLILKIKLIDDTSVNGEKGLNLRFVQADPVWIQVRNVSNTPPDGDCPNATGMDPFKFHPNQQAGIKKKMLEILAPAATSTRLYYVYKLNIEGKDGANHFRCDFDPVIENGGGNQGILNPWWFAWVPLLAGVAFVGVAFMAAYAAGVL